MFGQDAALEHVDRAVKVWRRGRRTDKPLPFLFCGASGVGKTEVSKALAEALFDTDKALNRYDMGEFMEKNDVTKLIGAPPGYDGFAAGGEMTNSVRANPYQVMLWDEVEKAHPDIFNVCLNILDDGRCRDNLGRKVEFGDVVMPMTTNIGADHALRVGTGPGDLTEEEAYELTIRDLKKAFRTEFLNRFDGRENIILFRKLNMDTIEKIVFREISRINAFYASQSIEVRFPEAAAAGVLRQDLFARDRRARPARPHQADRGHDRREDDGGRASSAGRSTSASMPRAAISRRTGSPMTEKPRNDADALLDGIDKTLSDFKTRAYEAKKAYDQSDVGRAHRELTALGRFWSQFVHSCGWIYMQLIAPITWRIYRAIRWAFARYRALVGALRLRQGCLRRSGIQQGARRDDDPRDDCRLLRRLLASPRSPGPCPGTCATVRHDEQLYLSNSQNLSGQADGHEIHEVYGCETLPCTDQNTVTFRVRATWFNEVWSVLHHGALFYPGYVAAAVNPVREPLHHHLLRHPQEIPGTSLGALSRPRAGRMHADQRRMRARTAR